MTGTRNTIKITWFDGAIGVFGDSREQVYADWQTHRARGFAAWLAANPTVEQVTIAHPEGEIAFARGDDGGWFEQRRRERV